MQQRITIALLGLGNVGTAVLQRLANWQQQGLFSALQLVYAANSRQAFVRADSGQARQGHDCSTALLPGFAAQPIAADAPFAGLLQALGHDGVRIVIDATANAEVTAQHAHWLAQGIHVVTACKLGQGTTLARWQAIAEAKQRGNSCYGDAATVGAGLPLLASIRALRAGGDSIHAIAGVLSGSLAWLFHHYDGMRPFSGFVRQARDAGFTEPDPRDDLSGEDVRRKILILARAAGMALEEDAVQVRSLVPDSLAKALQADVDAGLQMLDAPMRQAYADAHRQGEKVLRFIARWQHGQVQVGVEALAADNPLAGGSGTDNRVAIWSDRYATQPLLIQGPGAGAEVTAAGLLDDVLAIARSQSA